jgi:uncharacterized BrkB/YihY/UPF0761 family membrane protein
MENLIIYLIAFVGGIIVILWGISLYLMKAQGLEAKAWVKEWSTRSLGLPQGSVRALIAFLLVFILIYLIITGVPDDLELPDWLIGILGTVIGFYFGTALIPKQQPKEDEKPKT